MKKKSRKLEISPEGQNHVLESQQLTSAASYVPKQNAKIKTVPHFQTLPSLPRTRSPTASWPPPPCRWPPTWAGVTGCPGCHRPWSLARIRWTGIKVVRVPPGTYPPEPLRPRGRIRVGEMPSPIERTQHDFQLLHASIWKWNGILLPKLFWPSVRKKMF